MPADKINKHSICEYHIKDRSTFKFDADGCVTGIELNNLPPELQSLMPTEGEGIKDMTVSYGYDADDNLQVMLPLSENVRLVVTCG